MHLWHMVPFSFARWTPYPRTLTMWSAICSTVSVILATSSVFRRAPYALISTGPSRIRYLTKLDYLSILSPIQSVPRSPISGSSSMRPKRSNALATCSREYSLLLTQVLVKTPRQMRGLVIELGCDLPGLLLGVVEQISLYPSSGSIGVLRAKVDRMVTFPLLRCLGQFLLVPGLPLL